MRVKCKDIIKGKLKGKDVLIIKQIDIHDNKGDHVRPAVMNKSLIDLIQNKVADFSTDPNAEKNTIKIYNELREKNPLLDKLADKLDLEIII